PDPGYTLIVIARAVTSLNSTLTAEDYTVSYSENTEVGTATITITGSGSYTGTLTYTFAITKQSVAVPAADGTAYTYNGNSQTYVLTASDLYLVSGNVQTDAGSYTVTAVLADTGHYQWSDGTTDAKTYAFTIAAKEISDGDFTIYAEYDQETEGWVLDVVLNSTIMEDGDYEVSEIDDDYCFTITGKGNYTGTLSYWIDDGIIVEF
ncbi:MAG: hypothetical protein LUD53_05755, partial [Clostridiales bacterium]|nr:hypothetical protein [Clostridiales bacterium]